MKSYKIVIPRVVPLDGVAEGPLAARVEEALPEPDGTSSTTTITTNNNSNSNNKIIIS